MSLIFESVVQFRKTLGQVDGWFDKAAAYAQSRSFDAVLLLDARLAPDQYPLVRQVQIACDSAKFAAARLSGKPAPKHPDTERTVDEVRERIRVTAAYVEGFRAADFEGAESRLIELPALGGKVMAGVDYLVQQVGPNFYFHVTTAYAILRHNGVPLGKRDFLGASNARER